MGVRRGSRASSGNGGGTSYAVGHCYARTTPATAGAGAVFQDIDARQEDVSSGDDTIGWSVILPTRLGSDRAGLAPNGGTMLMSGAGLTGLGIGTCTIVVLFTHDASLPSVVYALAATGDGPGATRGLQLYLRNDGGTLTIASAKNGALVSLQAAPGAGLHCLAVTLVDHGTHHAAWRWSLDGAAVDQLDMSSDYAAPLAADVFGVGSRSDGYGLDGGEIHDVAIWESTLSDADLRAVSTLPGTPTYRLPITSGMGVPAVRAEARRYDPSLAVLPVQGLSLPLTVSAGVRKVDH